MNQPVADRRPLAPYGGLLRLVAVVAVIIAIVLFSLVIWGHPKDPTGFLGGGGLAVCASVLILLGV